jgi:hypothetical protein
MPRSSRVRQLDRLCNSWEHISRAAESGTKKKPGGLSPAGLVDLTIGTAVSA